MSGVGELGAADPGNVRVSIAQYLMEYLYFDGAYVNPDRMNRVTVIGFGSPERTHTLVDLTPLQSPDDVQNAQSQVVAENLGATSFISALRLVREQFPPETDREPRQRIIVMLTDGGPYDERATRAVNPFTYRDYFNEIGDYYFNELGSDRFPLYVIGIDRANLYWNNVSAYWDNIAGPGQAIRVTEIEQTNRTIVRLLCPLLNPQQPEDYCSLADLGPHFVQPYARLVQFSFFKYDPAAQVRLYRPGEYPNYVTPSDSDVQFRATYMRDQTRDEIYIVSHPQPGCWLTAREGAGQVDVFVQVVFNRINITSPREAQTQILPFEILLELLDSSGNLIREISDYPIYLTAELTQDNNTYSRFLEFENREVGVYVTKEPLLLTNPGFYTLSIEGHTSIPSSLDPSCIDVAHNIPVFEREFFQVFVTQPELRVTSPEMPHLRYGPISEMALAFYDQDGQMLMIPEDVPWQMILEAHSPSGLVIELPAPIWERGSFHINSPFLLPEDGVYELIATLLDNDGNVMLQYQSSFTTTENLALLIPGPNYPAFAPLREISLALLDKDDEIIEQDPNYPLELQVEILGPNDLTLWTPLLSTGPQANYRVNGLNWRFEQPALYNVVITGSTRLAPGDPLVPVFIAQRTINGSGNLPYFVVQEPDELVDNITYPLHYWFLPPFDFALRPVPVRAELFYGTQPASAVEFFVDNSQDLFVLSLHGPVTQTLTPLLPMSADAQVFGADLGGLRDPGDYVVTILLDGTIRANVPSEGAWPARSIAFTLEDPPIYTVLWWLIMGVIALLVLTILGWIILDRLLLPKAEGTLILKSTTTNSEIKLQPKARHRIVLRKKKGIGTIWQIEKIVIRGRKREDKKKRIEIKVYGDNWTVKGELVAGAGASQGKLTDNSKFRLLNQNTIYSIEYSD